MRGTANLHALAAAVSAAGYSARPIGAAASVDETTQRKETTRSNLIEELQEHLELGLHPGERHRFPAVRMDRLDLDPEFQCGPLDLCGTDGREDSAPADQRHLLPDPGIRHRDEDLHVDDVDAISAREGTQLRYGRLGEVGAEVEHLSDGVEAEEPQAGPDEHRGEPVVEGQADLVDPPVGVCRMQQGEAGRGK
ncbi:copper-translocating P-type ATPase [Methylorubrum populi]|uniref:Copper-translocating P-type ATPase n=1 Tax=Methylorubrum populi TaxID=223967 RepID=A0A160PFD2_9HYPH|nr:hypothetical protein [Methylorubrum populi]BAU91356.1 copper-translocating P-type ATPase [Methylorubrum populi]